MTSSYLKSIKDFLCLYTSELIVASNHSSQLIGLSPRRYFALPPFHGGLDNIGQLASIT